MSTILRDKLFCENNANAIMEQNLSISNTLFISKCEAFSCVIVHERVRKVRVNIFFDYLQLLPDHFFLLFVGLTFSKYECLNSSLISDF